MLEKAGTGLQTPKRDEEKVVIKTMLTRARALFVLCGLLPVLKVNFCPCGFIPFIAKQGIKTRISSGMVA